jgi:hypothetical protein
VAKDRGDREGISTRICKPRRLRMTQIVKPKITDLRVIEFRHPRDLNPIYIEHALTGLLD